MDLDRLNVLIVETGITKVALAKHLGITPQGLYLKLKGTNDFTRREVSILCDVLRITDLKEKEAIFF
ncbi:MAG: hypothetical protein GX218_03390 [Clostridiaceae bacterium]|jgi:predicted transcriptional regulator|nr:hypothetical protein [Clostridiaceae bacterium]